MDVAIRSAQPAEFTAIGALTVDVYGGERLVGELYLPVLEDTAARAAAPSTEVLVATDPTTGELLASYTLSRAGSPFAALAVEGEAEIRMLAVRADVRRRGIGEALVRDAIERSRGYGCGRLVLFTMPTMVPAQRMYERIGFQRTPDRDQVLRQGFTLLAYTLEL